MCIYVAKFVQWTAKNFNSRVILNRWLESEAGWQWKVKLMGEKGRGKIRARSKKLRLRGVSWVLTRKIF